MIQATIVRPSLMGPAQRKVALLAMIVLISGAFGMTKSRMKVSMVCRDARLFMDGGYSALVKIGGIIPKMSVSIYQKQAQNQINLGEFEIQANGADQKGMIKNFNGNGFNLSIFEEAKRFGNVAMMQAKLDGKEISVAMRCQ